jgi:hypothetical protein
MPDYQKGKIYKMVGYGKTYYGSTTQPLCERKSQHKQNFLKNKNGTCSKELYNLGNDIDIVLVETYPCNNKEELHQRERYYIENNECINKMIPIREVEEKKLLKKIYTQNKKDKINEWREKNRDKINEDKKKYRENNKDKIKEMNIRYYEKNKELIHKKNEIKNREKITCACGAVIRKDSIYKHIKRKSHNDNITT